MPNLRPGDLIFFAGRGLTSSVIQLATYSLPTRGYSHVAIVGQLHGRPLLYESTSFPRPACVRQDKVVRGVQAHWPETIINDDYEGRIYHMPLRRELYRHEVERLCYRLDYALGRGYDMIGAARSGGFALRYFTSLVHEESDATLFCSELAAQVLVEIGVMKTRHYSRWNPNSLARRLLLDGVCDKPRRLLNGEVDSIRGNDSGRVAAVDDGGASLPRRVA